ncbi:MAG: hypothetical protein KF729_31505 [Sandaracinaceae bacterium]|nr:hypothetical protein [Sandaracinaceae bacterium]
MPALPRWLCLGLLPLAALSDAIAYYACRMMLPVHLLDRGGDTEDIVAATSAMGVASLVGTLLAGLASIATGPFALAPLGALGLAASGALLALAPAELAAFPAVFLGASHGVLRTALLGGAARAFPDLRTEHARNAAFFALYGVSNLGAVAIRGWAREADPTVSFLGGAGFGGLAFLATLGLAIAVWVTREQKDALTEPPAREGHAHLWVAGASLVVGALVWALWPYAFEAVFDLVRASEGSFREHAALIDANPIVVTLVCTVALAVALGLHALKVRPFSVIPLGVGLLLVSAGGVALLRAEAVSDSVVWPAVVVVSLGEAIAAPLVLSRLAGDLPKWAPTLAIAAFYVVSGAPSVLLRLVAPDLELTVALGAPGAAAAGLAGLAALVAGLLLLRVPRPDPARPAEF